MAKWRYDNVRAVFAMANDELRSTVRQSVRRFGMRNCEDVLTVAALEDRLRLDDIDLLITTPHLAGIDVGGLLQEVRHGRVGPNPFLIVVTLLDAPCPDMARRVVDSGTDDLLLTPLSATQLVERLDSFVMGRRPFVVTHDYVGPDRRGGNRSDGEAVARIEVPNPIRYQVVANADGSSLGEQIREAGQRLNLQKIKCYGEQVSFLIGRIVVAFGESGSQSGILADVQALSKVGCDMVRRIVGTNFVHGVELLTALCRLCDRMSESDRNPKPAEIGILPILAKGIERLLAEDPEAISWAKAALVL